MSRNKEAMQYTCISQLTKVISSQEQLFPTPQRAYAPLLSTPTPFRNAQNSTVASGPSLRGEYGFMLDNARKQELCIF